MFTDDSRWMTVVRTTNVPLEEYLVSYQSLLPSTIYSFRVIAYNKYGISYPVTSDDVVIFFNHCCVALASTNRSNDRFLVFRIVALK